MTKIETVLLTGKTHTTLSGRDGPLNFPGFSPTHQIEPNGTRRRSLAYLRGYLPAE